MIGDHGLRRHACSDHRRPARPRVDDHRLTPVFNQCLPDHAGENIGRNNYPDSQSTSMTMTAFMASTDHRDNILDHHYTNAGVGVAIAPDGMKYFVVTFSSR